MKYLLYEEKDKNVGVLTINRPEALNALNSGVIAELQTCLAELAKKAEEHSLRCLILTGAGEKSFVAGADIAEMRSMTVEEGRAFGLEGDKVMEALEDFPCPVIAAVNGFALGGGLELTLSCDIRIASTKASFALPETGLGIIPGYGGIQRLSRLVGAGFAKEMVYTTNRIKADAALSIGLVNHVYEPEALMTEAIALAEKITSNAPCAIAAAKKVANASVGLELSKSTRLENPAFGACFATEDQKEAMAAFVEKRPHSPFTGK
ncbi:MAG: enoyl-CoA hydratase/isomerase family protein [Spirochaetaceae bacterium]|jgi:enoyl-CoA hydratase|nr:enoyl-CoA hydratase/isomerase family protein [Spirochaetaceae bacterium]